MQTTKISFRQAELMEMRRKQDREDLIAAILFGFWSLILVVGVVYYSLEATKHVPL